MSFAHLVIIRLLRLKLMFRKTGQSDKTLRNGRGAEYHESVSKSMMTTRSAAEMGDRLATINIGGMHLFGRGAGSEFNTMLPAYLSTYLSCGILIRLSVWPQ